MDREKIANKKTPLVIIGVLLTSCLLFFSNHGLLVLDTADVNTDISINKVGGQNNDDKSTIRGKKILLVTTGSYEIIANKKSTNLKSIYYANVKPFIKKSVNIKFKHQKASINLGDNELGCTIYNAENGQIIYKLCDNLRGDNNIYYFTKNGDNVRSTTRPFFEQDLTKYRSSVYMGGMIDVVPIEDKWGIAKLTPIDDSFKESPSAYHLSQNPLGIYTNQQDNLAESFAVLTQDKKLLVFQNINDQNPKQVDISKNISTETNTSIIGNIASNHLVLFNGTTSDDILGDTDNTGSSNQKIIDINFENEKVRETKLPKNAVVNSVSTNSDLETAIGSTSPDGKGHIIYFVNKNGKVTTSPVLSSYSGSNICWIGKSLYLSTNYNMVVEFSKRENSMYTIYEGPDIALSNLSCVGTNLYFTLNTSGESSDPTVRHFMIDFNTDLPEKDKNNRPENIFPIIGDEKNNITIADFFKKQITVQYRDFNDLTFTHSCSISEKERKNVMEYINSLGIDFSGYTFSISYDCGPATR